MAEEAPVAAVPAAPPKPVKPRKSGGGKPAKKSSPGAKELILEAVAQSKDRKGISTQALKKILASKGYDVEHNAAIIRRVIKKLVESGALIQAKGTGASGSYRAGKTAKPTGGKPVVKTRKPSPKKAPKKLTKQPKKSPKKPVSAKKASKSTTPKKSKKPATAKKPVTAKKPSAVKTAKSPKRAAIKDTTKSKKKSISKKMGPSKKASKK